MSINTTQHQEKLRLIFNDGGQQSNGNTIYNNYVSRAIADGATPQPQASEECVRFRFLNIYNKEKDARLICAPLYNKAAVLYSQIPSSGAGDFTVVRNTTATRVNASGLISSVAANVPRIDYTGGGCGKLLVEPAATNLALYSEEFDNAGWAKVNTTITENNFTAPNGTMTADRMNIADLTSRVTRSFSLGATTITFSVYIYSDVSFTLRIVAVVDGSNVTRSITVPAGQWTRFAGTFTSIATITSVAIRGLAGGSTGDIFLWGAQLETGSVATSYIPTVASTVTRNADVISISSVSGLIGQAEGSVYVEVDLRDMNTGVFRRLIAISDNTSSNLMQINLLNSSSRIQFNITTAGVSQASMLSTPAYSGVVKMAFAYALNDVVLYVNGVQIATDNSATIPACSKINLGSTFDGAAQLNDRISAAAIYTTRLSDPELIALTSL